MQAITISPLLILLALQAQTAPQAARPNTPAIPRETVMQERGMLSRSALMVAKGQFEQAEAFLRPILPAANVGVYVDEAGVPEARLPDYRKAVQKALDGWNKALAGATKFTLTRDDEQAGVQLDLVEDLRADLNGENLHFCLLGQLERQNRDGSKLLTHRVYRARISVSGPEVGQSHTPASITHLVGQAIGHYLGLADSESADDIMGADTHTGAASLVPSAADLQSVRSIRQARLQLMEFAQKHIAAYMQRPILAPEQTSVDAGDVWQGDKAHFVFTVKNTGDAPLDIEAKPNCGCTVASYDKTIAPGDVGKIEADMRTTAFKGRTIKIITVNSNDPDKPQMSLSIIANIRPVVTFAPASGSVLFLQGDGPTVKEFQLSVGGPEPVHVTWVACSAPFATAAMEPQGDPEEPAGYKVVLSIKAEAPIGRSIVTVTAFTDSKRQPQTSMAVICEKGIIATPVTAYMGTIAPSTPMPVRQLVLLRKSGSPFHITKTDSGDPKLKVEVEALKEGEQYRLKLSYQGGWSPGTIRGKILVETDDPQQPEIEVGVLATVLPAAQEARP